MNWWTQLKKTQSPRLLVEAELAPVQGTRFQPTGFPDLGPAEYVDGRGRRMLLVESAQSMANRLEAVCWDEGLGDLVEPLRGLPYVRVTIEETGDGKVETNSILEAHRLNSPYIVHSTVFGQIKEAVGFHDNQPFDRTKLAEALLRFDPSSLVHGIFLEKVGGVVRLPRLLSAFIEAEDVDVAASGGVKIDRVQPATGENTKYGNASEGYGNVPYHRDEYTAKRIVAYFNLDLALLGLLGLDDAQQQLVAALALYKVGAFLHGRGDALRLRTACDLRLLDEPKVTLPESWSMPALEELESELPKLIETVYAALGVPREQRMLQGRYTKGSGKKKG